MGVIYLFYLFFIGCFFATSGKRKFNFHGLVSFLGMLCLWCSTWRMTWGLIVSLLVWLPGWWRYCISSIWSFSYIGLAHYIFTGCFVYFT